MTRIKGNTFSRSERRESSRGMLLLTFLAVLTFTFNSSCRKQNDVVLQPSDTALQLIHTGYYWSPASQRYTACYWLDEKLFPLPEPGGRSAYAYGLNQSGRDLYIAGSYEANDADRLLPTYWQNGRKMELPYSAFEPFEKCTAKDILVWNGKVFISGSVDLRPVLWIVQNNGSVTQLFIDDKEGVRSSSNFYLHNNKLFLGGDKAHTQGNNYQFEVGYWTIDANGSATWFPVENNLRYATAFSIAISSGKIFIAGERNVLNDRSLDSYMNLWNEGGKVELQPIDEIAAYRLNEISPIDNNQMLLNAYDFKTHRPLVFKIGQDGRVLESIRPRIPAGMRGYCTNLAYKNGKLALGGFYTANDGNHLWVNLDDRDFELETPGAVQASTSTAKWIIK